MKIYLAAGFSVMKVRGRDRQLSLKFKPYRRLVSYHYLYELKKSELLLLNKEKYENN